MQKRGIISYFLCLLEVIKTNKYFYGYLGIEIFLGFYTIFSVFLGSQIITAIEGRNIDELYFWVYVFGGLTVVFLFSKLIVDAWYFQMMRDIEMFFVKKYYKKFIYLDNTEVEKYGTGKLESLINRGIVMGGDILVYCIDAFVSMLSLLYIFVLIFFKVPNIWYFLGFLGLFGLLILIFAVSVKFIVRIRKKSKEYMTQIDARKVRILMSKFEILQNKKDDYEIEKMLEIYKKEAKMTWDGHIKKGYFFALADAILKFFHIAIFVIIGVGVITGKYEMATFALLVWLVQILGEKSWELRKIIASIIGRFVHFEKFIDTFDEIPSQRDTSHLARFVFDTGKIEFQDVSFGYLKNKNILENFSLVLEGGKKYAFVGESGGGKTTIIKLLSSYIVPNSGKILIDNQDISAVSLESLYQNIGYLTQEPSVFDGTIFENLTYSLDNTPSEETIKKVLQKAKCDFVYALENGLQTEIGERGIRLSGGQKQRLAIAKIMLKNPKIILLDEPTSALDSLNEEKISQALENLFVDKTVITVAHRLQTIKNADTIFFVESGKIIERGNHAELIKKQGKYWKFLELQSGV